MCLRFDLVQAADIAVLKDSFGDPFVEIKGAVESGDLNKIQIAASQLLISKSEPAALRRPLTFHINTSGGDALEAMKIGGFFREILAAAQSYGRMIYAIGSKEEAQLSSRKDPDYVFIPATAKIQEDNIVRNYSAGVLMFYGAVKRAHRDNTDQRGYPKTLRIPVMGVHRPYFSKDYFSGLTPSQADVAYQQLETAVRSYLSRMGAPQVLADRMFTRPSTEIELIPDDEFRKFYKSEESFLQEWLIARCGVASESAALSESDLANFQRIDLFQIMSRQKDNDKESKSIYYIYPNPEFSGEYVAKLYKQLREHNSNVNRCQTSAVTTYQLTWARSFDSAAKGIATPSRK
jgi:hypothetical protein